MFSLDENNKPVDDGVVVPEPMVMPTNDDSPVTSSSPTSDPVTKPEPVASDDKSFLASDDLADLQKQAIGELAPILGKLNLSNEEKFNTVMMMVQATDDKNLLKEAHEAAKAIEDEKVRAQALLDIINEINYFTTKKD